MPGRNLLLVSKIVICVGMRGLKKICRYDVPTYYMTLLMRCKLGQRELPDKRKFVGCYKFDVRIYVFV